MHRIHYDLRLVGRIKVSLAALFLVCGVTSLAWSGQRAPAASLNPSRLFQIHNAMNTLDRVFEGGVGNHFEKIATFRGSPKTMLGYYLNHSDRSSNPNAKVYDDDKQDGMVFGGVGLLSDVGASRAIQLGVRYIADQTSQNEVRLKTLSASATRILTEQQADFGFDSARKNDCGTVGPFLLIFISEESATYRLDLNPCSKSLR